MSSFTIKIIAIVTMLIDHVKDGLLTKYSFLNVIGRIAFPLFAFQVAIGFEKTKNVYNYMKRMFLFALLSEIPYFFFIKKFVGGALWFNVMFTLLFGIMAMYIWDFRTNEKEGEREEGNKIANVLVKILNWILKIYLIVVLCIIAEFLKFDYGGLGVLFILLIHLLLKKGTKWLFAIIYFLYCIAEFREPLIYRGNKNAIPYVVFMYLPIVFMLLYNGKKGPSIKYFFYFFYPIHLTIILLISYLIGA